MKHLYRFLLMALAFVWADVGWAQEDSYGKNGIIKYDTCIYYRQGQKEFKEGLSRIKWKNYNISIPKFENAIGYLELHKKKYPQDTISDKLLDSLYGYWFVVSNIDNTEKNENKKHLEKVLANLSDLKLIGEFARHYYDGYSNSLNYCRRFQEFDTAIDNDFDFKGYPVFLPYLKDALYQHALLLVRSYVRNISDTTSMYYVEEIPVLDSCIGGQQLDRCIDDLNRIILLGQTESDTSNLDTLALVLLGECHYYKGEYEKSKEFYERSGYPSLFDEKRITDLQRHYKQGVYLYYGDSLHGVAPDYCGAFQEFETILGSDAGYENLPNLVPLVKSILYHHATLLFLSYYFNIPDTTNVCDLNRKIPEWDSCIGDQQLDRCIDDLDRIILLGQTESDTSNLDTLALVLLGECHYYNNEFKKATECYEKSGLSPDKLDIRAAYVFLNAYSNQDIEGNEQTMALTEAIIESWRNNYSLYRHLFLNNTSDGKKFFHAIMWQYVILNKDYVKALDILFKIRNNYSFSYELLFYQAYCQIYLGDFTATSDLAFAYHMYVDHLTQSSESFLKPSDENDTIRISIDSIFSILGIQACYYEKDYDFLVDRYTNDKMDADDDFDEQKTDSLLMLGICYQKLAEQEINPVTRENLYTSATKILREVIDIEKANGHFYSTTYAYHFLGDDVNAINTMDYILKNNLPSSAVCSNDSLVCHYIHYAAAEIFAATGELEQAKEHLSKAFMFFHEPWSIAFALKAPMLESIKEYVELEVERYKKELGISAPPIHRDTIVCDIPFRKRRVDNTRTISSVINGEPCDKMLFDPGANYMQITPEIATRIGITEDDVIGSQQFDLANGDVAEGKLVSLKEVRLGNIVLENVQAVIGIRPLIGCSIWNNLKVEMPSPVNKWMIRLTYIKESIEIPEDKKTPNNN